MEGLNKESNDEKRKEGKWNTAEKRNGLDGKKGSNKYRSNRTLSKNETNTDQEMPVHEKGKAGENE